MATIPKTALFFNVLKPHLNSTLFNTLLLFTNCRQYENGKVQCSLQQPGDGIHLQEMEPGDGINLEKLKGGQWTYYWKWPLAMYVCGYSYTIIHCLIYNSYVLGYCKDEIS